MEKEQGLKGYIRQNRAELFREIEDLIQNEDVTDIEWDGYYAVGYRFKERLLLP